MNVVGDKALNYSFHFGRFIEKESWACGKWMESGKSNIANTYVCWPNSS